MTKINEAEPAPPSDPPMKKAKTTDNDTTNGTTPQTQLRKVGFCGADDSVSPLKLGLICQSYPFVEFGILFRPDKEGEPRYATQKWVEQLGNVASKSNGKMTLAAHLCGSRVNDVLNGKAHAFLSKLHPLGFRRIQINATAVNGVDTSKLGEDETIQALLETVTAHGDLEFILQKNDETRPLCDGLLQCDDRNSGGVGKVPSNVTMLVDESKGTGVLAKSWPNPPDEYDIGYAGGIGPGNIKNVLEEVMIASKGRPIWIDMESSLRSEKNGKDIFDLDKCFECIEIVCKSGYFYHPPFLA